MKRFIFLLLIVSFGCAEKETQNSKEWTNTNTLKATDRWVISIDEETKRYGNLKSFSEDLSTLILFNEVNYSLYYYPTGDTTYTKKIKFMKEGPNGLTKVNHFLFHNEDSIFFFNDDSNILKIANEEGEVFFKERILNNDEPSFVPRVAKMQVLNGHLIMPVYGHRGTRPEWRNKSLLTYNLRDGTKSFLIDVPSEITGYYGGKMLSKSVALMNDDYVVSLSMTPAIQALKTSALDDRPRQIQFGSNKIHYPTPYEDDVNDRRATSYYHLTNSWNESLYFDKHSNTLLRAVSIGKKLDSENGSPANSGSSLSLNGDRVYVLTELFDGQFNKIGEVDNVVFYDGIFSTPDAIYMIDYEYEMSNEDIIAFTKYVVEPNENE